MVERRVTGSRTRKPTTNVARYQPFIPLEIIDEAPSVKLLYRYLIQEDRNMTLETIAKELGLTKSAITKSMQSLREHHLVYIEHDGAQNSRRVYRGLPSKVRTRPPRS